MASSESQMTPQLPAQFLAYKQKSEQAKMDSEAPRIGNTNCWGSFSFSQVMTDPRTSVSSVMSGGSGGGNLNFGDLQEGGRGGRGSGSFFPSRSSGASSSSYDRHNQHQHQHQHQHNHQEQHQHHHDHHQSPHNGSPSVEGRGSSSFFAQNKSLWSRFAALNLTSGNNNENVEVHSAELHSKSGLPKNTNMTNVDRLKSMAASAVQRPEIPEIDDDYNPSKLPPPQTGSIRSQSSYPSLTSSNSDGSSSLESYGNPHAAKMSSSSTSSSSSSSSNGGFWSLSSKFFKGSKTSTTPTGIGSSQDPSVGELKPSASMSSSFLPSSMLMSSAEEKKNIDIDKLKQLRDQAAGLLPTSPSAESQEEETTPIADPPSSNAPAVMVAATGSLESQIDDLEREMGLVTDSSNSSSSTTNSRYMVASAPHLRMDGFDDVHETYSSSPGRSAPATAGTTEATSRYGEIKVTSGSSFPRMDRLVPKKIPSPLAAFASHKPAQLSGGL